MMSRHPQTAATIVRAASCRTAMRCSSTFLQLGQRATTQSCTMSRHAPARARIQSARHRKCLSLCSIRSQHTSPISIGPYRLWLGWAMIRSLGNAFSDSIPLDLKYCLSTVFARDRNSREDSARFEVEKNCIGLGGMAGVSTPLSELPRKVVANRLEAKNVCSALPTAFHRVEWDLCGSALFYEKSWRTLRPFQRQIEWQEARLLATSPVG